MTSIRSFPSLLNGKSLAYSSPPSPDFDADIANLLSDSKNMEHLTAMSKSESGGWSIADAIQRRENQILMQNEGKGWFCTMAIQGTNEFVGICGLRDIDWYNRAAEMGIIIRHEHWGKGFGGEAHYVIFSHAFEVLQLERVILVTASANAPMVSFCKNVLNACHEGTGRHRFARSWTDPSKGYDDTEQFSLLRDEWPAVKARLAAKFHLDA